MKNYFTNKTVAIIFVEECVVLRSYNEAMLATGAAVSFEK